MSKRVQESILKEVSAVAKPRQMNLVSRNFLGAKKDLPQDLSNLSSPVNQELDQSCVSSRDRKMTRNSNPNPTVYSQERQQDDIHQSSSQETGAERWIFFLSPRQETGAS